MPTRGGKKQNRSKKQDVGHKGSGGWKEWPAHMVAGFLTASQVTEAFRSVHKANGLDMPGSFHYGKIAILIPSAQKTWVEGCRLEDPKRMAKVEKAWLQYKKEYKGDEKLVDLMNYSLLWEDIELELEKENWTEEEKFQDQLRMASDVRRDGAESVKVPGVKEGKRQLVLSYWNAEGLGAFITFARLHEKESLTLSHLEQRGPAAMLSAEVQQNHVTKYYDSLAFDKKKEKNFDAKFLLFSESLNEGELFDKNVFVVWWEKIEGEWREMEEAKQGGEEDVLRAMIKTSTRLTSPDLSDVQVDVLAKVISDGMVKLFREQAGEGEALFDSAFMAEKGDKKV
ncbi:hypothetical protein BU16DRAFT_561688 [Lophium mytilinum]|uniref:Uncharacterized protein n=1 Tax=Lophium mytilinum TaxID=390894 RepID=A0A6A6QTA1_9PEZI|nr:hypothetical protein BU16DRAFT_561688 [Lophium mytilinum]